MIDLRSDTCTRPTEAMREAMLHAPVGDDFYGDDPSVRILEERTAALLGKEDAVFTVTGTMANQVGLAAHTEPGDQVLMESGGHIFVSEGGAPAVLSGVSIKQIPGRGGHITPEQLQAALPYAHRFTPSSLDSPLRLLCLENTHNVAGGTIWPLEAMRAVTDTARNAGLSLHLDGARLWNASAGSGVDPATYAALFDTVSVCFSKGLGAPMGSALAGSRETITQARRYKQLFGGGVRQAGIMAAGAVFALEHHRDRLVQDHGHAAAFAMGLQALPGLEVDAASVQSNIVRFGLTSMESGEFADRCFNEGVHMLTAGSTGMRAVFHLDVSAEDTERAIDAIGRVVQS